MADFSNFSANKIHTLFSKERISSYDNMKQHFENFALIGSIAENIGIAEVLLRNKIDAVMYKIDSDWLNKLPVGDIKLEPPKEPNPSRDKIISIQSLGFWVRVAEHYKIEGKLFGKEFRKANSQNAVLVFDEVDSFLGDRRNATRNWECTKVNEMLTQ